MKSQKIPLTKWIILDIFKTTQWIVFDICTQALDIVMQSVKGLHSNCNYKRRNQSIFCLILSDKEMLCQEKWLLHILYVFSDKMELWECQEQEAQEQTIKALFNNTCEKVFLGFKTWNHFSARHLATGKKKQPLAVLTTCTQFSKNSWKHRENRFKCTVIRPAFESSWGGEEWRPISLHPCDPL